MKHMFDEKRAEILYEIFSRYADDIYIGDETNPCEVEIIESKKPFEVINPGPISSPYWLHMFMEDDEELWFEVDIEVEE